MMMTTNTALMDAANAKTQVQIRSCTAIATQRFGTGAVITTTLSFQSADGVAETTTYSSIQGFSTPGSGGMTKYGAVKRDLDWIYNLEFGLVGGYGRGAGRARRGTAGALVGSMCGFGFSGTYVPSTGSYYGGVVASCGIVPLGGGGASAAFIRFRADKIRMRLRMAPAVPLPFSQPGILQDRRSSNPREADRRWLESRQDLERRFRWLLE